MFHERPKLLVNFWPAIARNFKTSGHGHFEVVQDGSDKPTVPKKGLHGEIVDTQGIAELDILDCLM